MSFIHWIIVLAIVYFFRRPLARMFFGQVPSRKDVELLEGDGSYSADIVGESNYQDALMRICGGKKEESAESKQTAVLVLEDSNPYDDKAVKILIEGHCVGYLSRADARRFRQFVKGQGFTDIHYAAKARIVGGWKRGNDEGSFGVKLDLVY